MGDQQNDKQSTSISLGRVLNPQRQEAGKT